MSERPKPPSQDQEAKERLGPLGHEAIRVLKDVRPKMYQELESKNGLHLWAWDLQRRAKDRLGQLIERGARPDEAYETVASEYIQLPTEE